MGVGAVVLAAWLVYQLLPNDEKAIRQTMDRLVKAASINPNDSGFTRLAYADRLASFFTTNAVLSLEGLGADFPVINGHTDLRQSAMAARANLKQAEFELADVHVTMRNDPHHANAYIAIRGQVNYETNRFGQAFRLTLTKVGGRWLISELNTVERQ